MGRTELLLVLGIGFLLWQQSQKKETTTTTTTVGQTAAAPSSVGSGLAEVGANVATAIDSIIGLFKK